ncbi:acyltransferase [Hafnia alvei]|uniref:acyltransferase family protein n=1 Tax=Hafnia alvei TaxID=569 RepID=UPI0010347FED|nr:acyltransferase family protein [Hafnia alvei]TBL37351.1 acyltransferase [Hafnia alvei]
MSDKVKSVEGIRGIACLVVLLSHLSLIFYPYLHGQRENLIKSNFDRYIFDYPFGFIYSGTSAVFVFFCLSGYILTYACEKKHEILHASTNMLVARYIRLVLPVFSSVLLCYLTLSFIPDLRNDLPWISSWGRNISNEDGVIDVIYNGFFSSVFLADNKYNGVIWTMQIELIGSYILLLSIPIIRNLIYKKTSLLIIIVILVMCLPGKHGICFSSIFLGSLIYWIKEIRSKVLSGLLLIFGLYLAGFKSMNSWYSYVNKLSTIILPGGVLDNYYFIPMLSGFILVLISVRSNVINFVTNNIISETLGKLSFSAYLIQLPVFYIVTPIVFDFISKRINSYDISSLSSSVISIISIYFASFFFYQYVDKKSISISKYFTHYVVKHDIRHKLLQKV